MLRSTCAREDGSGPARGIATLVGFRGRAARGTRALARSRSRRRRPVGWKRDLADAIITAGNSVVRDLAREDLELLLGQRARVEVRGSLPRDRSLGAVSHPQHAQHAVADLVV